MSLKTEAKRPATASERVAKAQRRAVENGARIVKAVLPPEAAAALDKLQAIEYATSATGCIARALVEAATTKRKR